MEIRTTQELLDDFHKVWGKKSDFVTKSDYIDKVKYKKWVSVESLKEWIKQNWACCGCSMCMSEKDAIKELEEKEDE